MEKRAIKLSLVFFSIIVIVCLIMASCSKTEAPAPSAPAPSAPEPSAPAEHIKLIMASGIPDHEIPSIMHNYWMDKVEEKTNGQVEFERNYAGTLGGVMEILSLVKEGAIDVGVLFAINHPAEIPLHGILNMGGWKDRYLASEAVRTIEWESEKTAPLLEAEGKKQNLKFVFWPNIGGFCVVSRTKATSMADLYGKKSTRFGFVADNVCKEFGMTTVATTSAEMYESLSKGVVDCSMASPTGVVPRKLHEVTVSYIFIPNYWCGGPLVVNYEKWEGLPPNVKQAMVEAEKETTEYNIPFVAEKEHEYEVVMKDAGLTVTPQLPEDELNRMWQVWMDTFQVDWVENQEQFGVRDEAKVVADLFMELNK